MEDLSDAEVSETGQLFTELAGEVRRSILLRLTERNMKLTELAKSLDTTIQHVHTNINRLTEAGLVERDSKGLVELTSYGRSVINQLPTFHFLTRHKEYFIEHSFGDLPLKFERRIGDLSNSTLVNGVTAVLQGWKLMYLEADEFINTITSQVLVDYIEPLANKVRSGIKLRYIMPENVVVPKGTMDMIKKVSWNALLAEGKAERKMVKKMFISTIVTDKSACVMFPGPRNEVDMEMMFQSNDTNFREWCADYFEYMWERAADFDKQKLRYES